MKYALLGYDLAGSVDELPAEDKRRLHREHRALHDEHAAANDPAVTVLAHYRFRPPRQVTTVARVGDDVVRREGPAGDASKTLRALYLLESDDADAVLELAGRLPAVEAGGTVEVWPLTEPEAREQPTHRHSGRVHEP